MRGSWIAGHAPASASACFETGGLVVRMVGERRRAAPPRSSPVCAFPRLGGSSSSSIPPAEGLSGEAERGAFGRLGAMGSRETGEICRLALMGALPSIAEGDIAGFGGGDHPGSSGCWATIFAPAQGGRRFHQPDVARVLDWPGGTKAPTGVGQSFVGVRQDSLSPRIRARRIAWRMPAARMA